MTARRSLNLKLALSIVLAFAVSMAVTWFVHDRLAAREADRLIDSAFSDVEMEIRSRVNARLVRQAMAVRERLEDCDCPKAFRGFPIALLAAGLLALSFMGFSGFKVFG